MLIITQENKISVPALAEMSKKMFGNVVKAVVDIEREILAIDADLHADLELLLSENGSKRANVWGINLYPEFFGIDKFIEFDSMINIKPQHGNRSWGVDDEKLKEKILEIIKNLIS